MPYNQLPIDQRVIGDRQSTDLPELDEVPALQRQLHSGDVVEAEVDDLLQPLLPQRLVDRLESV